MALRHWEGFYWHHLLLAQSEKLENNLGSWGPTDVCGRYGETDTFREDDRRYSRRTESDIRAFGFISRDTTSRRRSCEDGENSREYASQATLARVPEIHSFRPSATSFANQIRLKREPASATQ